MTIDIIRRLFVCIITCLLQVLVFNRICLLHVATPLMVVYFIIAMPRGYPRWGILLWSFFLGLAVDMFRNTPGVTAASLTIVGMVQPYLIELFLPRDAEPDIKASARALGWWHFLSLATILVVIFCIVFFILETFTFAAWLYCLQCAVASAVLTLTLIMAFETLRKK
jgi:rod shape-determining protein MreD